MYSDDEDDGQALPNERYKQSAPALSTNTEEEDSLRDVSISNPWAIAKFNAVARRPMLRESPSSKVKINRQVPTPRRQAGDVRDPSSDDIVDDPDTVLQDRAAPGHSHAAASVVSPTSPEPFPYPLKARAGRPDTVANIQQVHRENNVLDAWIPPSRNFHGQESQSLTSDDFPRDSTDPIHPQHHQAFVSARTLPLGTPLSEIPGVSQKHRRNPTPRKQQGNISKPFISPVNDPERVWFETGEPPPWKRHRKKESQTYNQDNTPASLSLRDDQSESSAPSISASARPMHPDLAITLDYEARKQKAGQAYRERLRQESIIEKMRQRSAGSKEARLTISSPHKNRRQKAIAALHSPNTNIVAKTAAAGSANMFEAGDPRGYLIRTLQHEKDNPHHSNDETEPRVSKRRKTALLPLETVREKDCVRELVQNLNITPETIRKDADTVAAWNEYITTGKSTDPFAAVDEGTVQEWEGLLRRMVSGLYSVEGGRMMIEEEDVSGRIDLAAAFSVSRASSAAVV